MDEEEQSPYEEDIDLEISMRRATRAMDDAGITPQDLMDELPAARDALMRRWYGDEFVDNLERQQATLRSEKGQQ